jgi:hypothetical protein
MKPRILEVVHARHARAAWAKAIKLVSRELGFKPGRDQISGLPGWIRDTDERRETFFFQINPYGFDKYSGGSSRIHERGQAPANLAAGSTLGASG